MSLGRHREKSGVACVCHVTYLSLSPRLLHFVPKFSIQKTKGGERRERASSEREDGRSAIMDFILNPLPISADITPKSDILEIAFFGGEMWTESGDLYRHGGNALAT